MPRRTKADPIAQRVGLRIRALREERSLTQESLAWGAGLRSKGHLSGIEKGLVLPTAQTLMALAERLEVDLFDLFVSPDASPREKLVDLTRSMPAGTIRRLVRDATRAQSERAGTMGDPEKTPADR